jgi:hypothetical protein
LLIEGVLVAKKDYNAPKHEFLDVPNLQVVKALQSLTSKGYVKTQFSWQWYYYTLTPEGVEYLREWYIFAVLCSETHVIHCCIPLGYTSPLRLSPPLTKRLHVLLVLPLSAQVLEKVPTALLVVVIAMTTARRKALLMSSGPSLLVLVGAPLGSKLLPLSCYSWYAMYYAPLSCMLLSIPQQGIKKSKMYS